MPDTPKIGNPLLDGALEGEGEEAGVSATVDGTGVQDDAKADVTSATEPATADQASGATLPPLPTQGVAGGVPVAEKDARQVLQEKAAAQAQQTPGQGEG